MTDRARLVSFQRAGWLASMLALCTASPAMAQQVWHVSVGGAGSGTAGAPFARIQQGIQAAQPGDTVLVAPGTYAESLTTVRGGSPGLPITIRAEGGRGTVIVSRKAQVLKVSHPEILIDGLTFDGQYAAADAVKLSSAADRFILRNAEVRRSGRDCVDMDAPEGVLFESSLIHRCLWWSGSTRQDAHGIVAGPVRGLTIRDVEIHTFSGDGIQLDPGRSLPGWDDVLIEDARIWLAPLATAENGFAAGVVPGENGVDTKTNIKAPRGSLVIRNTVASGFRNGLITNMAAFNLKEQIDATLDGVTVSASQIAFRLRGPGENGGAWVHLRNAVVHDVASGIRYEDGIELVEVSHATFGSGVGRVFHAANSGWGGVDVRNTLVLAGTLPTEAPASGRNLAVSSQAFVDASRHDYRLAAGPAVDAGSPIDGIDSDRDGAPRVQGAAPDLGAYERATTTPAGLVLSVTPVASNPTNALKLSWTNVAGESGYQVERSTDGQAYSRVKALAADKTTWTQSALVSGATYWYRVRPMLGGSPGAYSAPARITLAAEGAVPTAPAALAGKPASADPKTSVALSWQDTSLEEDGFYVERSLDGASFTTVATRPVNAKSHTVKGLASGRTYWFRVRGFNGRGSGKPSPVVSVKTR